MHRVLHPSRCHSPLLIACANSNLILPVFPLMQSSLPCKFSRKCKSLANANVSKRLSAFLRRIGLTVFFYSCHSLFLLRPRTVSDNGQMQTATILSPCRPILLWISQTHSGILSAHFLWHFLLKRVLAICLFFQLCINIY